MLQTGEPVAVSNKEKADMFVEGFKQCVVQGVWEVRGVGRGRSDDC